MTTPTIDFVMPYGVTVEGDGVTRTATPVTKSKNLRSGWVSLMPGPCRVAVSWSGPETVRLVLAGVGYPVTIPAGGVSVRDGCCRCQGGRPDLSRKRHRPAAHQGRTRHYRGLPPQLRVAHRAGAVV